MSNVKSYQPISCDFYDELEALATMCNPCRITYLDANMQESVRIGKIIDLRTRNKEEFMILEGSHEIRLDRIIRVNELDPNDHKYC